MPGSALKRLIEQGQQRRFHERVLGGDRPRLLEGAILRVVVEGCKQQVVIAGERPARRPDALRGGTDDSNVEPWRIDDRRPAPWPSDELQVELEVLDDDNDGVPNEKDRCPDTPVGTRVDRNGCPMSVKESELLDTGTLRLENVYFDTEKSTIKPESYDVLNEVGAILEKWPELRIEIGGHTDDTGTEELAG